MKNIFKLLLLAVFFQSCGPTYYYSTINSVGNHVKQPTEKGFTVTKDDVSLTYFFNADDGKFSIEINNRTNEELFVDWTHSFLIAENRRTWNNYSDTISIVCAYSYDGNRNLKFPEENVPTIWVEAQPRLIVPVHSSVNRALNGMQAFKVTVLPDNLSQKQYKGEKVKQISFDAENTPILFNSYLTLRSERSNTQIIYDNLFYVSGFLSSKSLLLHAMQEELARGNTYYYKKIPKEQEKGKDVAKSVLQGAGLIAFELLKLMLLEPNNTR